MLFHRSLFFQRSKKRKIPTNTSGKQQAKTPVFTISLYPDFTVGFGISPNLQLSPPSDYTAGGDILPALKIVKF